MRRPDSDAESSSATARCLRGSDQRKLKSRHTAIASASISGSDPELERGEDTVRPDPFAHPTWRSAARRHERLGMLLLEAVQMRAVLAPQVQQMLESLGRDECRAGAAPLEQRVRRGRRPV